MNRTEFLKTCGAACLGGSMLSPLLTGCAASMAITANVIGSDLILPESEFEFLKNDKVQFRSYRVVQNDQLEYPVCVYRLAPHTYSALWMRCSHQGTELQAFGDKLHCPAHGSEFNQRGGVTNGPAADALRTFSVAVVDGQLQISLK